MQHPLVIIGAGPIGLAAAANAAERGMDFVVLEAGGGRRRRDRRVGARAAVLRLVRADRPRRPAPPRGGRRLDGARRDAYPTGGEWRDAYLQPLADLLDATAGGSVRYGARVVGVSRAGRDLLVDSGRESDPFAVHVETAAGRERLLASAVVDASGTWTQPNPLGADGYPALGERENAERRSPTASPTSPTRPSPPATPASTSPSPARAPRPRACSSAWPGSPRRTPSTRVSWLLRRPSVGDAFGGGDNDQLEQRGKLGQDAKAAATQRTGHQRDPVPHRVRHRPRPTGG